uniref:Uncharacterized protein n=1 Tax=Plectus sambesii TaxID=2011161 RepID=A0A914XR14_9BILA
MASSIVPENGINRSNALGYADPRFLSDNSTPAESDLQTDYDLRTRVVIILNSMNEEERRSVINVIKGRSIELNSNLVLKDKISQKDVCVPASLVWQLLQESWPEQCDREYDPKIIVPNRAPNFPLPKTPRCCGKLSKKKKLALAFFALALVAVICGAVLFAVLSLMRSESNADLYNITVRAQFESFIKTTGFDGNSLRYDYDHQRVFVMSITNGSMSVLTWNGHEVQDFQFDVRYIIGDSLTAGQRRCSLIGITTSNRPILLCVLPSRLNESSVVVNLFNVDDRVSEFHFPGSDSTNKIVLVDIAEADERVVWYSLQLKNRFSNISSLTYDAGVGFGRISASDAAFVPTANGFAKPNDTNLDQPWSVYAIRSEHSDNSLNVLHLQPTVKAGGICNFAFVDKAVVKRNCTGLENLFEFFNDFMGTSRIIPADSLEPPEAMLVQGNYWNGQEWTKIWVVYVIAHSSPEDNNWSPSVGHLYLNFYDTNGMHISNFTHSTADDINLSQQNPTGMVVASSDSLFVWFSGHDGSSALAQYKLNVCFGDKSDNCSPLLFNI